MENELKKVLRKVNFIVFVNKFQSIHMSHYVLDKHHFAKDNKLPRKTLYFCKFCHVSVSREKKQLIEKSMKVHDIFIKKVKFT